MTPAFILLAALCLAYANGANDNFKGVATLLGSKTTNYARALVYGTVATLAGSLAAMFLSTRLLQNFSGRGLVQGELSAAPLYLAAVGLGAGLTVLLATRLGMPVSTTHSLVGALVGAGWVAGSFINWQNLVAVFFVPLLASPFLAMAGAGICYALLHRIRRYSRVTERTCLCARTEAVEATPVLGPTLALRSAEQVTFTMGSITSCQKGNDANLLSLKATTLLDVLHYLSAGVVSFARGLNDTPKIAALLLLVPFAGNSASVALIGVAIAVGGLLGAVRVAEVLSHRITPLNHGQGFTANLITGTLVIAASTLGLPVSTTHVSCGSLFGIGAVTRKARVGMIAGIATAWITTLPVAAILGAGSYWVLTQF